VPLILKTNDGGKRVMGMGMTEVISRLGRAKIFDAFRLSGPSPFGGNIQTASLVLNENFHISTLPLISQMPIIIAVDRDQGNAPYRQAHLETPHATDVFPAKSLRSANYDRW